MRLYYKTLKERRAGVIISAFLLLLSLALSIIYVIASDYIYRISPHLSLKGAITLFVLCVWHGFWFIFLFLSASVVSNEEKNGHTAKEKDDILAQLYDLILNSLDTYGLAWTDLETIWKVDAFHDFVDTWQEAKLLIKENRFDAPLVIEIKRVIEITLKYISITLEDDSGLFKSLEANKAEIEKMVRFGNAESMSRERFTALSQKTQKISADIKQAKNIFQDIIQKAKTVGLPIIDPETYKYRWYYVLKMNHYPD